MSRGIGGLLLESRVCCIHHLKYRTDSPLYSKSRMKTHSWLQRESVRTQVVFGASSAQQHMVVPFTLVVPFTMYPVPCTLYPFTLYPFTMCPLPFTLYPLLLAFTFTLTAFTFTFYRLPFTVYLYSLYIYRILRFTVTRCHRGQRLYEGSQSVRNTERSMWAEGWQTAATID